VCAALRTPVALEGLPVPHVLALPIHTTPETCSTGAGPFRRRSGRRRPRRSGRRRRWPA
jgi:hypothetical protein